MEEGSSYEQEKKKMQEELRQCELEIANEQHKYLTKTHRCGNLLTGFNGYLNRRILAKEKGRRGPDQQRPAVIRNEERMFSLSSMTSVVSLMRVQPRAELTIVEPLPVRRVTRNILERERREEQEEYEREQKQEEQAVQLVAEEMDWPDQYSVAHSLNRQGSLHRNHAPLKQAHRRFRSQGERSRTLSYNQSSPTKSTESLSECKKPRKSRACSQADKKSVPALKLRRKRIKRAASVAKVHATVREFSELQLQLQQSQMSESELLRGSMGAQSYNSDDVEFVSDKSNSEDSVNEFIRLANLQDTQG